MGAAPTPGPSRWLQLAVLCAVPLTMTLGNALLMPVLPDMGRAMALPRALAGLSVTAFSLTAGLGIPLAGYLADRYGRKVVVVPSLLIFGTGGLAAGAVGWWLAGDGFWLVLGARVLQGAGAAGMAYMAMAFVSDLFHGKSRVTALGFLEAASGLGKVLAPIGGALVGQALAWWAVFFVQGVLALAVAVAVWLLTREPEHDRVPGARAYFGAVGGVLRQKGSALLACLWVGAVAQFLLYGLLFFLSQELESDYGLRGVAKGVSLMWPVPMSAAAMGTGLLLRSHYGLLKGAVVTGILLGGAAMATVALGGDGWPLFLGAVGLGLGTGVQLPALNHLVTSSAEAAQRAGVTAIYGAVRFGGTALGPPLFGWLMAMAEPLPFWVATGLLALTALVAVWLIDPSRLGGEGGGPGQGSGRPAGWQLPANLPAGTRTGGERAT